MDWRLEAAATQHGRAARLDEVMTKRSRPVSTGDRRIASTDSPRPQLVERKCLVCEWQAAVIVRPGEVVDCPWCYGPTNILRVVEPAVERRGLKNPHAAALGRLGGLKGGQARAAALTSQQRRAIAVKAARARWKAAKKK